jgi:hypothetical protein
MYTRIDELIKNWIRTQTSVNQVQIRIFTVTLVIAGNKDLVKWDWGGHLPSLSIQNVEEAKLWFLPNFFGKKL